MGYETPQPPGGTVDTASTTIAGVVELATTAETTTGTDTTRAVTPDGLHDMTSLAGAAWLKDEDDMVSDSATTVPSQQSVKAYVDAKAVKLNITTTDQDVGTTGSSNDRTTFWTVSVPANTLGTANGITGKFVFEMGGQTSAATTENQIEMKYGATSVATVSIKQNAGATTIKGVVNFSLYGAGTTSSQEGLLTVMSDNFEGVTNVSSDIDFGTSAIDNTSDVNLTFTIKKRYNKDFSMKNGHIILLS